MKQEFVTLYGKVIIERGTVFFRSPYKPFSETAFAQIGYQAAFVFVFALQFFRDDHKQRFVGIIVMGLLMLIHLPDLYDRLFKRSYAGRIPLSRIVSSETTEDVHGLQITVTLHLENGRYRKVLFRKFENQHQAFLQTLSAHSGSMALA